MEKKETLPLEGGREKGGGEGLNRCSEKTQETLHGYRAAFMEASQRQANRRFLGFVVNNLLVGML